MASETVLDLARQGDSRIIAALINRLIKPKGITAKVTTLRRCLHILLESPHRLNQNATTTFIHQLIEQLDVQAVEQIKIYARQTGGLTIAWSQDVTLHPSGGLGALLLDLETDGNAAPPMAAAPIPFPPAPLPTPPVEDWTTGGPMPGTEPSIAEVAIDGTPAGIAPTNEAEAPELEAIAAVLPDPWFDQGPGVCQSSSSPGQSPVATAPISGGDQVSSESQPQVTTQDTVWQPAALEHPVAEADVVSSNPSMFDSELESPTLVPPPAEVEELPAFEDDDSDDGDEISDLFQRPEVALLIIFAFVVALWDIYLDLIEEPGADQPISGRELARRLGVNNSTISRRKDRPDFTAWAQDLDPDGVAWQYQDGMFAPHNPVDAAL